VTRQEARKQEYKESACEELTQYITARLSVVFNCEDFKCDYSNIETVIINCKFRLMYIQ
jgi:hypothetical protein